MELEKFHHKHVKVTDKWGESFTGVAEYAIPEFLMHEYGREEEGIFIEDLLVYRSQIASIEEIEVHGTAELRTENLVLRRYEPEDAETLHKKFGSDTDAGPYASLETAQETVKSLIRSYADEHTYAWVIETDDILIGMIAASLTEDGHTEVSFHIAHGWQGQGYEAEALQAVLEYLRVNEGISCISAWCASVDTESRQAMENAGMKLASMEKDALQAGDMIYDKLIYAYRTEITQQ